LFAQAEFEQTIQRRRVNPEVNALPADFERDVFIINFTFKQLLNRAEAQWIATLQVAGWRRRCTADCPVR